MVVTLFIVTAVTVPKSVPVIFNIVPVTPVNGENDVIVGGKQVGSGNVVVLRLFCAIVS